MSHLGDDGDDEDVDHQDIALTGLCNQGATCYLNSLVQTLYMTPEFRSALYEWSYDHCRDPSASACVPLQLQQLFAQLQLCEAPAVSTTALTTAFGWDYGDAFEQHDVQELNRLLCHALESCFAGTPSRALVARLYEGLMADRIECTQCHHVARRTDAFADISLVIDDDAVTSVQDALGLFVQPEVLDEHNLYACSACDAKVVAEKALTLHRLPHVLNLHLKRFHFDPVTYHRRKLNKCVTFPLELDMSPFVCDDGFDGDDDDADNDDEDEAEDVIDNGEDVDHEEQQSAFASPSSSTSTQQQQQQQRMDLVDDDEDNTHKSEDKDTHMYDLFSILVHSGGVSGGHYFAHIKHLENGKWYKFDDERVTAISEETALNVCGGYRQQSNAWGDVVRVPLTCNAYQLVYRKRTREPPVFPKDSQVPASLMAAVESANVAHRRLQERKKEAAEAVTLFVYHNRQFVQDFVGNRNMTWGTLREIIFATMVTADVPMDCARLRLYQASTPGNPFEGMEDLTLEQLGIRHNQCLLLEVKQPHEEWTPWSPDTMTLTVHLWDNATNCFAQPKRVTVSRDATLADLKSAITDVHGIPQNQQYVFSSVSVRTCRVLGNYSSSGNGRVRRRDAATTAWMSQMGSFGSTLMPADEGSVWGAHRRLVSHLGVRPESSIGVEHMPHGCFEVEPHVTQPMLAAMEHELPASAVLTAQEDFLNAIDTTYSTPEEPSHKRTLSLDRRRASLGRLRALLGQRLGREPSAFRILHTNWHGQQLELLGADDVDLTLRGVDDGSHFDVVLSSALDASYHALEVRVFPQVAVTTLHPGLVSAGRIAVRHGERVGDVKARLLPLLLSLRGTLWSLWSAMGDHLSDRSLAHVEPSHEAHALHRKVTVHTEKELRQAAEAWGLTPSATQSLCRHVRCRSRVEKRLTAVHDDDAVVSKEWLASLCHGSTGEYSLALEQLGEPAEPMPEKHVLALTMRWIGQARALTAPEEVVLPLGTSKAQLEQLLAQEKGIPLHNLRMARVWDRRQLVLDPPTWVSNLVWMDPPSVPLDNDTATTQEQQQPRDVGPGEEARDTAGSGPGHADEGDKRDVVHMHTYSDSDDSDDAWMQQQREQEQLHIAPGVAYVYKDVADDVAGVVSAPVAYHAYESPMWSDTDSDDWDNGWAHAGVPRDLSIRHHSPAGPSVHQGALAEAQQGQGQQEEAHRIGSDGCESYRSDEDYGKEEVHPLVGPEEPPGEPTVSWDSSSSGDYYDDDSDDSVIIHH